MAALSLLFASLLSASAFLGTPRALPLHRYCILQSDTLVTKVYDHNKKQSLKIREKILLTEDKDAPGSVVLHVENLDVQSGIRWTKLYYPRGAFMTFLQEGKPATATKAIVKKDGQEAEIPLSRVQKGANLLEEIFPLLATRTSPKKESLKWKGKALPGYRYAVDTTTETPVGESAVIIERYLGILWMTEQMPFGLFKADMEMTISFKGQKGIYQTQRTRFQVLSVGEE